MKIFNYNEDKKELTMQKIYGDNFSIIEIQERNLPHTLINRSLLRSIA